MTIYVVINSLRLLLLELYIYIDIDTIDTYIDTVLITASAYGKCPGDIKDHQDQSNIPQLQPWKNENNFDLPSLSTNVARPCKAIV